MNPKLKDTNNARKYAWTQYFKILDLSKNICNDIINLPDNIKSSPSVLPIFIKAREFTFCGICSEKMHSNIESEKLTITKCNHFFHKKCIDNLDIILCPNCGGKI
jgi:hypothetical protein